MAAFLVTRGGEARPIVRLGTAIEPVAPDALRAVARSGQAQRWESSGRRPVHAFPFGRREPGRAAVVVLIEEADLPGGPTLPAQLRLLAGQLAWWCIEQQDFVTVSDTPLDPAAVAGPSGVLQAAANAISDAALVLDADDNVLSMNQAFTDLTGYTMSDGPFRPPFPWWPTPSQNNAAHHQATEVLAQTRTGRDVDSDVVIRRKADGRELIVRSNGAGLRDERGELVARLRVVRDVTKDRAASNRRKTSAQAAAEFVGAEDFADLLRAADHGLSSLFDGLMVTVIIDIRRQEIVYSGRRFSSRDQLDPSDRRGVDGRPSADTQVLRPGVLLLPAQPGCVKARAWVRFGAPRRIGADELIVADLLAQALSLAAQRIVDTEQTTSRVAQLEQAIESHRAIGQAVGVLVERHRLRPEDAFARLRQVSQNRNLRLRELAEQVLATGEEPELV